MRHLPLRPTPTGAVRVPDPVPGRRRSPLLRWVLGSALGLALLPGALAAEQLTEPSTDASPARFYEEGRQLAGQGLWEEALATWDEARDEFADLSVRDPRIGFAYLELATQQEATEYYGTASEMLLWALSGRPIDDGREALRLELDRVRVILPDNERERWAAWDDAPDEDVAMRLKRFWV